MTSYQHTDLVWPCSLSDNVKEQLMAMAEYREGIEMLGLRLVNPEIKGMIYLLQGLVSASVVVEDSHMLVGGIMGTHDWIGAGQIASDSSPDIVCEELEPVTSLYFPGKKVLALAEQNFEVYKWLYFCSREMQARWAQTNLAALHNKESRVVFALVMLFLKKGMRSGIKTDVYISHQQLSNLTYVSRPRVSEVLKALEQEGIVEHDRHRLFLMDEKGLMARLNNLNVSIYDPRKRLAEKS